MGLLHEIIERKRQRLDAAKAHISLPELKSRIENAAEVRSFGEAVRRDPDATINVIAEVKKASPSKGVIRADFDPTAIATVYEEKGASAISVLTEEHFFQGDLEYIAQVKHACTKPVLRKDFIFDEYQIYEARAYDADAILLIAAILSRGQAEDYLHMAQEIGLSVLFEIHNYKELDMVLQTHAPIVGINNRNLDTLSIDLNTTIALLKDIPEGKIIVSESGISRRADVEILERTRVDAVLIGTALMKETDISKKYDVLFTV